VAFWVAQAIRGGRVVYGDRWWVFPYWNNFICDSESPLW